MTSPAQYRRAYQREWRQRNRDKVNGYHRKNYRQTQGAPNTRKVWTDAEDKKLLEFTGTDRELSALLGRSVMAIQVRRSRLGGGSS